MPHPTHRQLFAVGLGHPGETYPSAEDMHPLSRCSVGRPWGRSRAGQRSAVVRARPARRHRVVVSVDVSGHATASLGRPSRRPACPGEVTSSRPPHGPDRPAPPLRQAAFQCHPVDLAQSDRAAARGRPSTQPLADVVTLPPASGRVVALREVDGLARHHPGDLPARRGRASSDVKGTRVDLA